MMLRLVACLGFAAILSAADYIGPKPPQADLPYLLHATNLIPLDTGEAKEDKRAKETAYVLAGATAKAATPMAEPIFLLLSDKIPASALELYRVDVRNGAREIVLRLDSKRKPGEGRRLKMLFRPVAENLYRLDANETLEPGEYVLTPTGSNQVFSFRVF